jgi:SAM-dependent methyltransferase
MYMRRDCVWRKDLKALADEMTRALAGRRVLEVGCSTGFWTGIVAKVAKHVVVVDASEEMLAIARKRLRSGNVEYLCGDAYSLGAVLSKFDGGLASFWFSHVPKRRISEFLDGFHGRLEDGAVVFMADNVYTPGIGGLLVHKPGVEDTFKLRELSDGAKFEVLKDYYDHETLWSLFSPRTVSLRVHVSKYFWWVYYQTGQQLKCPKVG